MIYILGLYSPSWGCTTLAKLAKLFLNGRSQAVRLPLEFRFPGDRVRVTRHGRGVLLEPVTTDVARWFGEIDDYQAEPFMAEGRNQPVAPVRVDFA